MGVLDIVSLLILAILIVGALFPLLIVAAIPGVLAKKRHSPWAEAVNIAGWIGVLLPPPHLAGAVFMFVRDRCKLRRRRLCIRAQRDYSTWF
jgi:uncharacterized protein DUF3302